MQLFYIPEIKNNEAILDPVESKHAVKVLRLTNGSNVQIVDGKGGFYEAEIADANPKKCRLKIRNSTQNFGKRNFRLHVAIAPTKNNDRLEWFLEKATEIGIDEITPLITKHSERKTVNLERMEKKMISAMKQSLKAYLPKLNEAVAFNQLIASASEQEKFIAHCYEGNKPHLKSVVNKSTGVLVLIGPEGDFSRDEIELAGEKGFTGISLGNARLRTETAGIVACHIVNLIND